MSRIGSCLSDLESRSEFAVEALSKFLPNRLIVEALAASGRRTLRSRLLPLSFVAWLVILLGVFRRLSYENLLGRLEGSWDPGCLDPGPNPL